MGKKTEFLYLSEEEIIKAGALDYKRCIEVEEEIFKLLSVGDYVMGGDKFNSHGIEMDFPADSPFPNMPKAGPDRRFMAMPAYVGGRFNVVGQKWYGSNIINPSRGLPRSILTVMLNDADTCEPLCLMSANLISSVRTGCVPGVAAKYLANRDARCCACIGAGPIGRACFEGIVNATEGLSEIVIFDIAEDRAKAFAEFAREKYGVRAFAAKSLEEAVRAGDIVSVAASSVKPVVLENEWLKPGSLLIFSGRGKVMGDYFTEANIVWDNARMHAVYYDEHLALPEGERFVNGIAVQIYKMMYEKKIPPIGEACSLGDIICGDKPGRKSHDERICFIAGGMPVWDVGWGFDLYTRAKEMGLGTALTLWDDPYLA